MQFTNLLIRADEPILQTLVGVETLHLLKLLDPSMLAPQKLREVILSLYSPQELLLNPTTRQLLFELLREQEAKYLITVLGYPNSTDPYNDCLKLKIRRNSEQEQDLLTFFELSPIVKTEIQPQPANQTLNSQFGLFAHQRNAARKVQQALSKHPYKVLLHMPTGAGKTRTAMHIIANHLRQKEPTVVVWLAYSEELCEQAAQEFEKSWMYLGDREINVYRYWGDRELDINSLRDGFVVASLTKTYRSAISSLRFISTLASRCSLVIIDEAHQAIAETYQLILETLFSQGQTSGLLGLTATPGRTWNNVDVDEQLATFFARNKVTLTVDGYDNPVDYLVDQGYLAHCYYRSLFYNSGMELSSADIQKIEQELDIPKYILEKIALDAQRNLAIIVEIEQLVKRHQRIIVFAASVKHAQILASVLAARGFKAFAISADTPSSERARIITNYKMVSDEPQILCNFGVLTTGFDAPQTSAALIARPTRSLVLYSQMVGRAIRGKRVGGNTNAEIVTVVDTGLPGFGSVAEAFTNWEDVWSEL